MNPMALLLVFLESLSFATVLSSTLKPQRLRKLLFGKSLFILCIVVSNYFYSLAIRENDTFRGILVVGTIVLLSMIFYSGDTFARFFLVTFAYVLIVTIDVLLFIGFSLVNEKGVLTDHAFLLTRLWLPIISKLIVIALLLIFKKFLFSKDFAFANSSATSLFAVGLMLVNVVTVLNLADKPLADSTTTILSSLALVVLDLLLFYFVQKSYAQAKSENENACLMNQISFQAAHISEMTLLYDKQKSFMHDFRNHITTIRQLIDSSKYEQAQKYAQELSSELTIQQYEYQTGHEIIDALINTKASEAKAKNITLSVISNSLQSLTMPDIDIITLLSNLLDNAIEACQKVDIDAGREIVIKLEDKNSSFLVSIKNSMVLKPRFISKRPITTKRTVGIGGIGYLSIANTLAKYDADYEIFIENNSFQFISIINYTGERADML